MAYSNISLEISHGIAKVTLNRPKKLNSLNAETMVELLDAVDCVQNACEARVLLLTGAGKAFCAGQDLGDSAMHYIDGKAPDIGEVVNNYFKPLVLKLQNLNVPTIAAVNGIAAGGGASLALACDVVVASESALFLQAFSRIGLTPDTGSTWFLAHKVGSARAIGMTYFADKISAKIALEWGLIWASFNDEEFEDKSYELAVQLSKAPTKALVRTRELIAASENHTLEQQLSMEATYIRELGMSDDYAEGLLAFQEKRVPVFSGS